MYSFFTAFQNKPQFIMESKALALGKMESKALALGKMESKALALGKKVKAEALNSMARGNQKSAIRFTH